MDNYDKNIEDIENRLDEILGGFGKKIKSLAKGMVGDPYTDLDSNESGVKVGKGREDYINNHGSKEEKKALAGKPALYKIGNNYAQEVEDSLIPYLHFDIDEVETKSQGKLVHTSNAKEAIKINSSIEWLYKGVWKAQSLGLTKRAQKGRGSLKGKLITFAGVWESGAFMGVIKGGSITGGQIIDGFYLSGAEGFKIKPWDFKSGGISISSGFVMGMRLAKDNTQHKKLSLIQIPSGRLIKVIDNNDKEHLIKVEKGVDYSSANLKINGENVSWENYNKTGQDFSTSVLEVGKPFSIPGVINIEKGIQTIEVKTSEYESSKGSPENGEKENKEGEHWNRFDINTNERGWKPNVLNGYKLEIEEGESEAIANIKKFKDDINSGKFFRHISFFKQLMKEGRVDGYGNYPSLAFLFPKEIGKSYRNEDTERDSTMKYFSDFRKDVLNKFRSEKIGNYYLSLLKKGIIDSPEKAKAVTKTPAKKKSRATGTGLKKESKLSLVDLVKKVIKD